MRKGIMIVVFNNAIFTEFVPATVDSDGLAETIEAYGASKVVRGRITIIQDSDECEVVFVAKVAKDITSVLEHVYRDGRITMV
jgi:hypothetical protein